MGRYRKLGVNLDRNFRDDYNANVDDIEVDVDKSLADSSSAKQTADEAKAQSENAEIVANQANATSDDVQQQLNTIVIESGTSDAEVLQARGGEPVLNDRLNKVDTQLVEKAQVQFDDITVNIPSDFDTLQEAIDNLSERKPKQGKTIALQMESGYRPSKGLKVENGDYSHFIISSVDAEVLVSDDYTGNFLEAYRANAPKLSCLINANLKGGAGVWLDEQSDGYVSVGAGVKNTYDRGLYVNKTSRVWAEGSIFTGGRIQALWVSRVSTAFVDNAFFGGGGAESLDEPLSIHISRQSRVYGLNINVENSLGTAVKVQRGSIFSAPNGNFSGAQDNGVQITGGSIAYLESSLIENTGKIGLISQGASNVHAIKTSITANAGNTSNGVLCENASTLDIDQATVTGFGGFNVIANRVGTINASGTSISNSGNHGVYCEQGSSINLRSASVKDSGNKDLSILRGSFLNAFDCSTTNGVGSPALGDTNVTAFNAIQGSQGIIWS
ncbi:alanine-zipper protein [Rossellomorea aquimaris]|uniref:alanine-zipper protein n=1 Tax=Rossellomorea aquimaris TaxID=189382 RepID=UPI0011E968A9|nr:alanine-zipper protein [Rossellomorea aquimaris]TYS91892.1 hypothetical protein FZC88_07095 [Rossellomorea aquimaris]